MSRIQWALGCHVQGVSLTAHLHLLLRLQMSAAMPSLPLYAVMAWTGTNLPDL